MQGTSWANGKVSGSGTLESPIFNIRSGFAGFDSNSILSSNGKCNILSIEDRID